MNDAQKSAFQEFPGWFYGPDGQSAVFNNADEVPDGWEDHPSKVGNPTPDSALDSIPDDDNRLVGLMKLTQPELIDILDGAKEEIEFSRSWPKLKLAKTILANNVPFSV